MPSVVRARLRALALLVLVSVIPITAVTAATVTPAAADTVKVLINTDSLRSTTASLEKQQAEALGYTVTQVNGAQWLALTASDFAQYQALIVGDRCSSVPASVINSVNTWAPVVMGTTVNDAPGNRIVIGTDPATHGRPAIIKSGIAFAAANTGRTGLYYDMSCSATPAATATLAKISVGSGTWTTGPAPCGGSVSFISSHASFSTLRTTDLAGWGCSVHIAYPTFPDDYSPLAIATDTSTKPICGTDIDTAATACGQAYILVSGTGLVVTAPDMGVAPTTATVGTGSPHTVTASLKVGSAPLTGKLVKFTVSGQNAGLVGTCAPADCTSGSDGTVAFTYTGMEAGEDTLTASFTDSSGAMQQATASVVWTASNTPPTVAVTDVANGATYELGGVPVAGCSISDAQDGLSSTVAALGAVSGPKAAFGIGDQTASCSYTDHGGLSDSSSVTYTIVDTVKPTLSGAPATSPNSEGWYSGPVTINWSASDTGTGVDTASLPPAGLVSGEGTALVTSASVADNAGNPTTGFSSPVRIDTTAPLTGVDAPVDWRRGDVHVTLDPTDNLSGVVSTTYKVDDADALAGTTFTVSGEGEHTITFSSVDAAGNAEAPRTVVVRIDRTPPTITHRFDPRPNASGWNRTPVTVTFECGDGLSGVRSCTAPVTVTANGTSVVGGEAVDNAGNSSTDVAVISVDTVSPTIGGNVPQPNAAGWFNSAVAVDWDCADSGSGVASCASRVVFGDGAGQSAFGIAADTADNGATASVLGINVDSVKPTITGVATTAPNAAGWYSGDVVIHWTCVDALSGVVACPEDTTITATGANLGASAVIVDAAGNSAIGSVAGINIDRTAPITFASTGTATTNDAGWSTSPVTVSFGAADETSAVAVTLVGIDGGALAPYSAPIVIGDGVHTVRFHSVDLAGNSEAETALVVKVDTIVPTITATRTPANGNGWNNGSVVVTFSCADGGSGVDSCPAPITVSAAGADQAVVGQVSDRAGNAAAMTVTPINIDLVKPVVTYTGSTSYTVDQVVAITCTSTDVLSGVASSTCANVQGPATSFA
ncbi:MAG: hypothetical protein JWN29_4224, partial [Acidimicrobiales bacterium]|nr:hypothetical protein [Acidimicrobiales bacterium]